NGRMYGQTPVRSFQRHDRRGVCLPGYEGHRVRNSELLGRVSDVMKREEVEAALRALWPSVERGTNDWLVIGDVYAAYNEGVIFIRPKDMRKFPEHDKGPKYKAGEIT